MKLNSNLFTKPRRSARLDKCLVDDAAHVTLKQPRERGEHVTRIQLALLACMKNARFGSEASRAEYGPNTAAAVFHFKRERNILNTALRQTVPDNVVGKKTIAALDAEMLKKQLPPGRQPRVTMGVAPFRQLGFNNADDLLGQLVQLDLKDILGLDPIALAIPQDIFVQFDGGDAASEGTRRPAEELAISRKFGTPAYLLTHMPLRVICFVGGRGDKNKAKEAADEVALVRSFFKNGVTAIVGSSVGALPALDCAKSLSGRVALDYVGIDDGAFFAPNEVTFQPFRIAVATASIAAAKKQNFFQTAGHELLREKSGTGGFMNGTEFHGPLDGFANIDVAANPGRALRIEIKAGRDLAAAMPVGSFGRLKLLKGHADRIHTAAAEQAAVEIEKEKVQLFKP